MIYHLPHWINGKAYRQQSRQAGDLYNPALGEVIGQVDFADKSVCDLAVIAAQHALTTWAATPVNKRARIFFHYRQLLEKHQQELATLVTREQGKTLVDAKGSIARGIELVEHYCGLLALWQGAYTANVAQGIDCWTIRQPLGVCAGISPANFPVMIPIWMMIPAIACGNTFILKPSEQDPSSALRLVELLHEAGLPPGVVNCVHGDQTTVQHLLVHPDIVAYTAVGSTPAAKHIYTTVTAQGKRAQTFGGAKNHAVIMPDADLALTANAVVGAAYGASGERCMAISVVVAVGEETADQLRSQLIPLINAIKVDTGDAEQCDMGPLISEKHRQHVIACIEQGIDEGAELVIDGRHFKHPHHPKGYFLAPSLFDHVSQQMVIYQQEIFGPVLIMVRVNALAEAIQLVNQHPYGNGAAIFTRNGHAARTFSEQVNIGMVGINVPIPVPVNSHPFGGWKQSSFGDTQMHGMESIHFYTRRKTMTCRWHESFEQQSGFAMPHHS